MKRVIAVILTIIMIFTFASCGELTASSQSVTARITGKSKKTIKLEVKGAIVDCDKTMNIEPVFNGATYFAVKSEKDKGKSYTCNMIGLIPGTENFVLSISSQDRGAVASVIGTVTVDENLKLTCNGLDIVAGEYKELPNHTEEENGLVRIPVVEGYEALIDFKDGEGEWLPEPTDEELVATTYYGATGDGYTEYGFSGNGEGDTTVQFLNLDTMEQVVVSVGVTAIPVSEGVTAFGSEVVDYVYSEYTMEEYIARRGQGETILKIRAFDPDFMIPSEFVIDGFAIFDSAKDKEFEFDENTAVADVVIPENFDELNVDMLVDGKTLNMSASTKQTLAKAYKEAEDLGKPLMVEDFKIGDIDVRLYQTSYEFGYAVWTENEKVHTMTFVYEGSTFDSDKALLTQYFESRKL